MRVFLCAAALSANAPAFSQQQFHLGSERSKRAQQAMPVARCIWRERYSETLAFVDELERGMKAKAAMERVSGLEVACPQAARDGDIIAALVYYREAAVADCIKSKAGRAFQAFVAAGRKKDGAARQVFINNGFPAELRASAEACDRSLTYDFAREERATFAARTWGWK